MKLLVIIVQDTDAARLRDALSAQRIPFTKLSATGGFLRRGTCTFFSGVPDAQVEQVKTIISQNSKERTLPVHLPRGSDLSDFPLDEEPIKVTVGGATVFTLDVEEFIKL